jgi:hypothetical protein
VTAATGSMTTAATTMTAATAVAATPAFSRVGRGRQRRRKNKDNNPELGSRHDVPQWIWNSRV